MEVSANFWLSQGKRDEVAVLHPEIRDEIRAEKAGAGEDFIGASRCHQNTPYCIFRVAPQRRGGQSGGGDACHGDIAWRQRLASGDVPGHDHDAGLLAGRGEGTRRRGKEQDCGCYAAKDNATLMPRSAQNVKKTHALLDCTRRRMVPEKSMESAQANEASETRVLATASAFRAR